MTQPVLKFEPIKFLIISGCHSFQMKFKLRDASNQIKVEANYVQHDSETRHKY